jgi:3-hydroxyisobutyrate dehydrogenase-like beta-hydroxyacid dehydrogenase
MNLDIGLIGYGEVGKIFTNALKAKTGRWVGAWDLRFANAATRDAERAHAAGHSVDACDSAAALCGKSTLIISAVTASNTLAVAQEVARAIKPGTLYLDFNSASPGTKTRCAALIDATGGHYVEAGVMTSVPPYGIKVPMLLGGQHAAALAELLRPLGLDVTPVADKIGVASAIKMCRSVMIKGLEALVIESYTTARAYGVEEHMIPTLYETFPGIDWNQQGAYFFSRVVQHGKRRAEEMVEAANTVREAGFEPFMSSGTAGKQDWVAQQAKAGVFDGVAKDARWQDYADRLLEHSLQKK